MNISERKPAYRARMATLFPLLGIAIFWIVPPDIDVGAVVPYATMLAVLPALLISIVIAFWALWGIFHKLQPRVDTSKTLRWIPILFLLFLTSPIVAFVFYNLNSSFLFFMRVQYCAGGFILSIWGWWIVSRLEKEGGVQVFQQTGTRGGESSRLILVEPLDIQVDFPRFLRAVGEKDIDRVLDYGQYYSQIKKQLEGITQSDEQEISIIQKNLPLLNNLLTISGRLHRLYDSILPIAMITGVVVFGVSLPLVFIPFPANLGSILRLGLPFLIPGILLILFQGILWFEGKRSQRLVSETLQKVTEPQHQALSEAANKLESSS